MIRLRSRAGSIGVAVIAASLLVAGCGVPSSSDFQAFNANDVRGFGVEGTTTTTTASPGDTSLASSTTVEITTTTIATEPVTLYFLAGNRLSSVSIALARPASPVQVLAALVSGPPAGQVGTGLRSALPISVKLGVADARGGVVVDVPVGFFERIPNPPDQRLAVAQVVLTLTERGGIGAVQFTQEGTPIAVPLGTGVSAQPGAVLYRDNYASLLGIDPAPTTDPGVTTATATTQASTQATAR